MFKKFGYDSGTRLVNKSEYSESAWADLIQGEIKAGRPVVYMAANSSGSSHCFCIDGYNSSDDTYHVNFGWGETYNGWHEMNSFKYESDTYLFNQNQKAVIGIQPARQPYAVVSDDGLTLTFYYDANKPTGDKVLDLPFTAGHYPSTNNKNITTATFDPSFADCHDLTTTNTMFFMCDKLQTINNLEYLNTENVTDMAGMFYGCSSLESLDLSHFDTKNVTGNGMDGMFYECSSLKSLDVSSFEISDGLTDMKLMFYECSALETIYCAEGADWSTSGAYKSNMFYGCTSLSGKCGSKKFECDGENDVDGTYAKAYMGDDDEGGYFTAKYAYAVLSDDGKTLTFRYDAEKALWQTEVGKNNVYDIPWGSGTPGWRSNNTITTVTFDESFKDYNGLKSTSYMFYYLTGLESFNGLENLNVSNVTDMSYMFFDCCKLKTLDLGDNFDTSSVTNMDNMFYSCSSLTSLDLGDKFNTSNVTNMCMMFWNCKALTELDLSSFDIDKVTDMSNMFSNCSALETIYCAEGTDWSGVSNTSNMFSGCTSLSGKYGSKEFECDGENDVDGTYAKVCTASQDGYFTAISQKPEAYAVLSSDGKTLTFRYDAEKPAGAYDIPWGTGDNDYPGWEGNPNITTVTFDESFDAYHDFTSLRGMFANLIGLKTINHLEYLNTENVEDMSYMFLQCIALESLDVSNFNTENVTDMNNMFYGCVALKELDVSNFDTGNVTDMTYMFSYCSALTELDLSNFDTKKVTNMSYMFEGSSSLETIYCAEGADWSGVAGRNYTDMFKGCTSLSGKCGSKEFKFDPEEIKGTYAKVYDGTNGGYFTYKGNRSYTLEVGEAGMATLYLDFDAVIPEGVEVYYCTGLDDDEALPEAYAVKITQGVIPANTGVFVKAEPGKYLFNAFIPVETDGVTQMLQIYPDNILTGTLEDKTVEPHSVLTLGYSNQTNELGFWWFTGKTPIPANRAYIPGDKLTEGGVKGIRIVFDEETGIATTNLTNQTNEAGAWYTIDGRKLEGKPQQRGLYINNGKKIIIK